MRDAGFSAGNFPSVYLQQIEFDMKRVDVLIIKNNPKERPYYLENQYPSNKKMRGQKIIHAGTIYSRIRDTNTPINKVASPNDIERMWRERFGLDKTPLDRLKIYLQNHLVGQEKWIQIEEEKFWYYSDFPEFTITYKINEYGVSKPEPWALMGLNPKHSVGCYVIKFHQTILWKKEGITFDEFRETIPNPSLGFRTTKFSNPLWGFFLIADTIEFLLLQFTKQVSKEDLLKKGIQCGRGVRSIDRRDNRLPILLFKSNKEKELFEKYLDQNPVNEKHDYRIRFSIFDLNDLKIQTEGALKWDIEKINYTYALIDRLNEWRLRNQG